MDWRDAVFDALRFESYDESYSILRRGGVVVGYGMNLPGLTGTPPRPVFPAVMKLLAKKPAFWRGKTIFYYVTRDAKTFVPDLETLFDLLKTGKLSVQIKAVYPLEGIQDAHRVDERFRDGFGGHQGLEVAPRHRQHPSGFGLDAMVRGMTIVSRQSHTYNPT